MTLIPLDFARHRILQCSSSVSTTHSPLPISHIVQGAIPPQEVSAYTFAVAWLLAGSLSIKGRMNLKVGPRRMQMGLRQLGWIRNPHVGIWAAGFRIRCG